MSQLSVNSSKSMWFVQVVSVRGQDVCYRFDPRLAEADSAGCSAYYGTDKGQLAPSGIANRDSVYTLPSLFVHAERYTFCLIALLHS